MASTPGSTPGSEAGPLDEPGHPPSTALDSPPNPKQRGATGNAMTEHSKASREARPGSLRARRSSVRSPEARAARDAARNAARRVQRIDSRERRMGYAAAIALALVFIVSLAPHLHEHVTTSQIQPAEGLIIGLSLAALIAIGTAIGRRATLGFSVFLAGFAMLSLGSMLLALPFLAIAGWLVIRGYRAEHGKDGAPDPASQHGKDSANAAKSRVEPAKTKRFSILKRSHKTKTGSPRANRGQPRPNKRYTPPKPKPGTPEAVKAYRSRASRPHASRSSQ